MGGRGRRSAKTAPTAVLERNSACDASCLQVPSPSGRRLGGAGPRVPAHGSTTSVQTAGRACPNAGRCLAGNVGPCRDGGAGRADSAIRHSGPALKGAAALGAGAAAVRNSGPHSVLQLGPAGLLRASSATRAKPALRVFCRAAPPPHKRSSSSSVPPLLQVGMCPYITQQRSLLQFARPPSPAPLSLFTTQFMLPSIHIPPQAGDAARRCILTCVGARAHCCSGEWRMMREPPSLLRTPSRVGSGHIPRRSSVEAIAKQKLRAGEGETEAGRKGGREGPPPPHHSRAAAQPPTSVPQW